MVSAVPPATMAARPSASTAPSTPVAASPPTKSAPITAPPTKSPTTESVPSKSPPVGVVPPAGWPQILHTFPWWDHPQGFNTRPDDAYTLPTTLKSARPCRLADLETFVEADPIMGNVLGWLAFHNVSSTRCELHGSPYLELLDRRGTVWQSNGPETDSPTPAVVLVPNSWAASSNWGVGASCGGSGATTTLRVRLPGGSATRDLPLAVGTPGPGHCGGKEQVPVPHPHQLGVPSIQPIDPPSGTGHFVLFDSLTPSVQVPAAVGRGDVLRYTLFLTSTGQSGVGNELCPLYDQHLSGVAGGGSYELRCDLTVNLDSGQAVAYDLELKLPADARLGPTTLTFKFLEPDLPALAAPVTVVS
jgi:Protein of unknown function (DUF4232)